MTSAGSAIDMWGGLAVLSRVLVARDIGTLLQSEGTMHDTFEALPDAVEEWKWRGVPVWTHSGIICTGEVYRSSVKMRCAHEASLANRVKLFNSSLDGNTPRAIDLRDGDSFDRRALMSLICEAAAWNGAEHCVTHAGFEPSRPPVHA